MHAKFLIELNIDGPLGPKTTTMAGLEDLGNRAMDRLLKAMSELSPRPIAVQLGLTATELGQITDAPESDSFDHAPTDAVIH